MAVQTMRSQVNLLAAIRQAIRDRDDRPVCAKCRKPVEIAGIDELPSMLVVTLLCHDAVERVQLLVDEMDFAIRPEAAFRRLLAQWPKHVFLRNWAAYKTTTRPERRVVR